MRLGLILGAVATASSAFASPGLRFRSDGTFTVLQVADMHIANGRLSGCVDLSEEQRSRGPCSDLNTTEFVRRAIRHVSPDLLVFTGDNILVDEATDVGESLALAFSAAIETKVPWVATLGNHDQAGEPNGLRSKLMGAISALPGFAGALGASDMHNGAGTFAVHVTPQNQSHAGGLTLMLLDTGGFIPGIEGYDFLRKEQLHWLERTAANARKQSPATALAFLHIPLPAYAVMLEAGASISGAWQQQVASSLFDAGSFEAVLRAKDVRAVFAGHDHVNDLCGLWKGVQLCYAGGCGYHAYGKAGWERRVRVIKSYATGAAVASWKVLDRPAADGAVSPTDCEMLWARSGSEHAEIDVCRAEGIPSARRHPAQSPYE